MTPTEEELVHGEVDGLNPSAASVAAQALIAADPAAGALADDLRRMDVLFRRVEERAPSPHLRDAILAAVPPSGRTAPAMAGSAAGWQGVAGWLSAPLGVLERLIGGGVLTRKVMLLGMTGVAIIAIVGGSLLTDAPSDGVAGTIGGDDKIAGVQKASRYRGRTMSERDVTLGDAQIAVLLQNPDVQRLIRNDAFQSLMSNDAFAATFNSAAFAAAFNSPAFAAAFNRDAFAAAFNSAAFTSEVRAVFSNDAFRTAMQSDAFRTAMQSDAFRTAMQSDAFRDAMQSDAFRQAMQNDAFRQAMQSDAFRDAMQNDMKNRQP